MGIPEGCWHPVAMANSPSGDSVTDRLLRVLETFTPTRTVQTAAEIGRRAGLPTSTAPARLVRFGRMTSDQWRYVCVESARPDGTLLIFFFRHDDGTWHVFPPAKNLCRMSFEPLVV